MNAINSYINRKIDYLNQKARGVLYLGLGFLAGAIVGTHNSTPQSISFRDLDADGYEDVIVTPRKAIPSIFLNKNGEYIKVEEILREKSESTEEPRLEYFGNKVEDNLKDRRQE